MYGAEKKEESIEELGVQFNLGSEQLVLIGKLMTTASVNQLSNNLNGWYKAVKGIKLQITARTKPEESRKLAKLELCINSCLVVVNGFDDWTDDNNKWKRYTQSKRYASRFIEAYDNCVMNILESRNYLVPGKVGRGSLFGHDSDRDDVDDEVLEAPVSNAEDESNGEN